MTDKVVDTCLFSLIFLFLVEGFQVIQVIFKSWFFLLITFISDFPWEFRNFGIDLSHVLCSLFILLWSIEPFRWCRNHWLFHYCQFRLWHCFDFLMKIFPDLFCKSWLLFNEGFNSLFSFLTFMSKSLFLFLDSVQKETREFRFINIFEISYFLFPFFILNSLSFKIFFLMFFHVIKTKFSFPFVFLKFLFHFFSFYLILL